MISHTDKEILCNYNIDELLKFISINDKYKNIALQFDDKLLSSSLLFLNILKENFRSKFFFIIGETSYGLCCADEIAALHLNADLIIRVGNSCFSLNKQIPIYFLFETKTIDLSKVEESLKSIMEEGKEIFLFYKHNYHQKIKSIGGDKITLALIPYRPDAFDKHEDFIYGRYMSKEKKIKREDIIVYIGNEDDQLCNELAYRYQSNISSLYLMDCESFPDYTMRKIDLNDVQSWRSFFQKRYHLIQKARDSQVFGIIVGSLSIRGLNGILESIKATLRLQNKKFYTFLLGKITLEKLSNFVDYVDCFVLITCPFNSFYDFKALMRPLVTPLDIKHAFDTDYQWNLSYSFDINYILEADKGKCLSEDLSQLQIKENTKLEHKDITSLSETEKNQMVANIFSIRVLENFDNKKYKGLETNFQNSEVKKIIKGKRGIPLKYEDIK